MRSPIGILIDVVLVVAPVLLIAVLSLRAGYVQRRDARRAQEPDQE